MIRRLDLQVIFKAMSDIGFTLVTTVNSTAVLAIIMEGHEHHLKLIWENQMVRVVLSTNEDHENTSQVFAVGGDQIETLIQAVIANLLALGLIDEPNVVPF